MLAKKRYAQNVSASTRGSSLTLPLLALANGIRPKNRRIASPNHQVRREGIVSGATEELYELPSINEARDRPVAYRQSKAQEGTILLSGSGALDIAYRHDMRQQSIKSRKESELTTSMLSCSHNALVGAKDG